VQRCLAPAHAERATAARGLRQPASAMIEPFALTAAMVASGKPKLLASQWRGALASRNGLHGDQHSVFKSLSDKAKVKPVNQI